MLQGCCGDLALITFAALFNSVLQDLPMRVEYMSGVGRLTTMVLKFIDMDESADFSTWELADVKANQAVKGRGLSKKQKAQRYSIKLSELERVRIYVDF